MTARSRSTLLALLDVWSKAEDAFPGVENITHLCIELGLPVPKRGPDDPTVTAYACGYENSPGSFGMWAGPTPDLKAMLDTVPEYNGRRAVLFQFAPDPDHPGEQIDTQLYVYDHARAQWLPIVVPKPITM